VRNKKQIDVMADRAKYRCPPGLQELIDAVNEIDETSDEKWERIEKRNPFQAFDEKNLCKGIHQIAQLASLPPGNMREEYAKAVTGTEEEWDRFCQRLATKLWRKWPDLYAREWRWPLISFELVIEVDGKIGPHYHNMLNALWGIEAKRLKECRHCQQIFWASRIDMVACGNRCAGTLRAKTFRDKKKRDAEDARRRKKP
jgi:hypothetical protein